MSIEAYRQIENKLVETQNLQELMVGEIAHKLSKEPAVIERAIYLACVTTGSRPIDVAHIVNEFLLFLKEDAIRMSTNEVKSEQV